MSVICMVAISVCLVSAAITNAAETYSTSFESIDGFNIGPLPQAGWEVVGDGNAVVQDYIVVEGSQALEIGPNTVVDKSLAGLFAGEEIWLDAWTQVTPQVSFPDLETIGEGSSLVHFNSAGISCLDGDGSGGGVWKNTGVSLAPGEWVRITIRQDYGTPTWDCYVNGVLDPEVEGIGFKDDISSLSGFKGASNPDSSSYLDLFRISTIPPAFIYPVKRLSFFEFSTVWKEDLNETSFVPNLNTFRKYDFSLDDQVSVDDLLYLIEHNPSVENETNF